MRILRSLVLLLGLMLLAGVQARAQTTFAYDSTKVCLSGEWTPMSGGGHNYMFSTGSYSGLDFTFTGTDCSIQVRSFSAGTFHLTAIVDGGAPTSIAITGNWVFVPFATGKSEGTHTVNIRADNDIFSSVLLDTDNSFQVTGMTPAIALPTGFGPHITTIGTEWAAKVGQEGNFLPYATGGYDGIWNGGAGYVDDEIRFFAKADTITFWLQCSGQYFEVSQDNVIINTVAPSSDGKFRHLVMASGLDVSTIHEYKIAQRRHGQSLMIYMMLSGMGAGLQAHTYVVRPRPIICTGDSNTEGANDVGDPTYNFDSRTGWVYKLSLLAGRPIWNRGVSGQKSGDLVSRAADDFFNVPDHADIFIMIGTNDITAMVPQMTYTTQCTQILNAALASNVTARVWVLGIIPQNPANTSIPLYNGYMQDAIVACNNPGRVTYVSTTSWINPATQLQGLHMTNSGTTAFAAQVNALIPPLPTFRRGFGVIHGFRYIH